MLRAVSQVLDPVNVASECSLLTPMQSINAKLAGQLKASEEI